MAEPTLTFGSVASLSDSTTSTPNPDSAPSSPTTPTHTQSQIIGDPVYGSGSGMSQVENPNAPGSILPLGPVFGSSVVLVIVVVLAMRWKRQGSWRGVVGLGDGMEGIGIGIGGGAEGELGRQPEMFDSYVLFKPSFVEKCTEEEEWADWTWRDVKPISAKLAPSNVPATSPSPLPDAETPTRTTLQQQPNPPGRPTSLFQKAFSSSRAAKNTNINNVDCSCQQLSVSFPQKPKLRPPPRRIHVTVLISMPTPPSPPPTSPPPRQGQQLSFVYDDDNFDYNNTNNYNDNDDNEREQNDNDNDDDDDDEKLSHYETASDASSVSEIAKEKAKAKANARSRRARSDAAFDRDERTIARLPRTADLSLALGITEVDVYDLSS